MSAPFYGPPHPGSVDTGWDEVDGLPMPCDACAQDGASTCNKVLDGPTAWCDGP